jgi:site-specific DNA-methyltransferase (adenine-specific)
MWERLNKLIKPNGAIVLFGSEPFSSALRMSNIKSYRYDWVWEKPQGVDPLLSKKRPLNNIENVIVFYKRLPVYNPQFENGEPYSITRDRKSRLCEINGHEFKETTTKNNGYRYPKRVLKFNREVGLHPTQKPVALMEYLIKTYTNEGDTVLDFTMGSFTTAIACLNTKRHFIGIELDEHYFLIGKERIENHLKTLECKPKIVYNLK